MNMKREMESVVPALEELSSMCPSANLKESLEHLTDAIKKGATEETLLLGVGMATLKSFLDVFKSIDSSLRDLVLLGKEMATDVELAREGQTGIIKALGDLAVEVGNHRQ